MALVRLVWKTFTVRQKSAKTAKVFFHVGFVVYGIFWGQLQYIISEIRGCVTKRRLLDLVLDSR